MSGDRFEVFGCIHCGRVTLFPFPAESFPGGAECACGGEFYPVSFAGSFGKPYSLRRIATEGLRGLVRETEGDR